MNFKAIPNVLLTTLSCLFVACACNPLPREASEDLRDIQNGHIIHKDAGYSDQPFVVITKEGNWLCVVTTGAGKEGEPGQHIIALESRDKGETWSRISEVEPADGPHASWGNPLVLPNGRIYVFYTYNKDNIQNTERNDMLGSFAFKYSDDHGHTWSKQRYEIPIRETSIDRTNLMKGAQKFFWSVDKPVIASEQVYMMFTKWEDFSHNVPGEGFLLKSKNIMTESDPSLIEWNMLPGGDVGLTGPEGPMSEEHNMVVLDDGSLYCIYRTRDGYLGHTYSRDDGQTWTGPEHATYLPGGKKRLKNPRANARIEKFENGKYILWYHHYGGRQFRYPRDLSRNPVWITGGVEKNGLIYWSEPEILLYDLNPKSRMSYPDWIHDPSGTWITETQKVVARVHEVDRSLLEAMWNQGNVRSVTRKGLILEADEDEFLKNNLKVPEVPDLSTGNGMSIDLWVAFKDLEESQVILSAEDKERRGFLVETGANQTVTIRLSDGEQRVRWSSDSGLLTRNVLHHIVFNVDAKSKVLSVVVDGKLCDGGDNRSYGWTRFPEQLGRMKWTGDLLVSPDLSSEDGKTPFEGKVKSLRIYNRYLLTSEAVANYLAGVKNEGDPTSGSPAWEARTRSMLEEMASNLSETLKPWEVPERTFEVETYGAVADGKTVNTHAIQAAIDACAESGGGVVLFGQGDYVTGTIDLKSGVMLEIAGDARILGSTDLSDYPDRIARRKTVMDTHMDIRHSLIFAEGLERVGLRGPGTIDFRGTKENFPGDRKPSWGKLPGRPFGMRFIDSKQIVVENITLKNSPSWMQSYLNCEDLIFQKIRNFNYTNHNQDGLDIDGCRRVIVRDCYLDTYDDVLCFKGASLRPTEEILVENCTFFSETNSLKFGTDSQSHFRKVVLRNVVLGGAPKDSSRTFHHENRLGATTSGIDLATVDGGNVEDILIKDVTINRAQCPIFLRVGSRGRLMPGMPEAPVGKLRRVIIENVRGSGNLIQGSFISGIRKGLVEDVIIRNVDLRVSGGVTEIPGTVREDEKGYPDATQFENPLPAYGFWIRHARNIHLQNVRVTPENEDVRPMVLTGGNTEGIFVDTP